MLIEIWDYFMRRKKLLLAVIAVFVISGCIVTQILQQVGLRQEEPGVQDREITYIEIRKWGAPEEVEIPHTGEVLPSGDAEAWSSTAADLEVMTDSGVISPAEVASLPILPDRIRNDVLEDFDWAEEITPISDEELKRIVADIVEDGFDIREDVVTEDAVQNTLPTLEPEVVCEQHTLTFWEAAGEVVLLLLGLGALILLGYLTYQHFMR